MGAKIDALLDFIFDPEEAEEREEMRKKIEEASDRLYNTRGLLRQAKHNIANKNNQEAMECVEEAERQLTPENPA